MSVLKPASRHLARPGLAGEVALDPLQRNGLLFEGLHPQVNDEHEDGYPALPAA